jgi:hypothetical protein
MTEERMSCVDSVSRTPVDNSTALNPQTIQGSSASIQATQVKVSQSQTADITIVTAEGDTVTLSSSKTAELSFATYNAQGHTADSSATISGASTELHRTSAFSISVDGDLNKAELKDIRSAIRTMQKAANDVLKGHGEKAAARTARLSDLDQLASVDADMEFNREVSMTQVSAQSGTTAVPESAEVQVPTPVPASTTDSQQTQTSEAVTPAPAGTPVETPTAAAMVTTATASTHLSVLFQTQASATSVSAPDASGSGLWWFPSQDLWNTLHPKKDSVKPSVPTAGTPATA